VTVTRPTVAVGTIVARNYVSYARVLARSLQRHHPHLPFFVLLADDAASPFDAGAEGLCVVRLEDLEIPDVRWLCFRWDRQQLAAALKPQLLQHLLLRGYDVAVFLDPDVLVVDDLSAVFAAAAGRAVTLTPHLLSPLIGCEGVARELNILQSGTFNAGFVAVSRGDTACRFLRWWQERTTAQCSHRVADGVYFDQRWLDLAATLFEGVGVLRDPGCNVAYWNLPERDVRIGNGSIHVDGVPAKFFHFSGFMPPKPDAVTRHSPRLTLASVGAAAPLFEEFARLLTEAGYDETRGWPYAFDRFDDGTPISPRAREIHAGLGAAADRFGDPFHTTRSPSFLGWVRERG
jgi:hypothetical protein